jgi:glutathione reductase (NADPH)
MFINQFNLYISLLEIIDTLYLFKLMQIVDPHTVSVNGKLYTARNILIAVGGRPSMPNIQGIEHVIDSDAALDLPSRPDKIAIVGGGYIALEFAGIFNGLKSDVHVFIRQKKVLRGFDEEVRKHPLRQKKVLDIIIE